MGMHGPWPRRAALRLGVLAGVGAVAAACGTKTDDSAVGQAPSSPAPPPSEPAVTDPDQALARLKAGAERFASGGVHRPDQDTTYRATLSAGQHPFACVLSCVDSRVPPEIVFDQGLGDLFVTRTAGQVVDHAVLGSIQYGVAELKIPLVLVLGHEKCGAVKATVEAVEKGSPPGGNDIDALVAAIKPAVQQAEDAKAADMLDASVRNNVKNIVADLGARPVLSAAVAAGTLKVAGARYDLDTGEVEFL
ncbi:carbonic anhydrase [Dactylosporangium sp. CA-092794]|uniref:carbonic anhydrase n=1 Tax=Dactylosporangium sp. CA-092794 TaxID=3239929 RepID=UPI003D94DBAC